MNFAEVALNNTAKQHALNMQPALKLEMSNSPLLSTSKQNSKLQEQGRIHDSISRVRVGRVSDYGRTDGRTDGREESNTRD